MLALFCSFMECFKVDHFESGILLLFGLPCQGTFVLVRPCVLLCVSTCILLIYPSRPNTPSFFDIDGRNVNILFNYY